VLFSGDGAVGVAGVFPALFFETGAGVGFRIEPPRVVKQISSSGGEDACWPAENIAPLEY
jgi:hypothetical protein